RERRAPEVGDRAAAGGVVEEGDADDGPVLLLLEPDHAAGARRRRADLHVELRAERDGLLEDRAEAGPARVERPAVDLLLREPEDDALRQLSSRPPGAPGGVKPGRRLDGRVQVLARGRHEPRGYH